jgi:hypothetical protein
LTECSKEQILALIENLYDLRKQKDAAYSERNKLVAVLSKLFPSYLAKHEESDKTWDDDWRTIVVIEAPTGQCSWHIHDDETSLFKHLEYKDDYVWDGHTTEEKYKRILNMQEVKF